MDTQEGDGYIEKTILPVSSLVLFSFLFLVHSQAEQQHPYASPSIMCITREKMTYSEPRHSTVL